MAEHISGQLLNEPLDVSFVIKAKFSGVAEQFDLFAQDEHAKAMKGGEGDLFADGGSNELLYAVSHFGRRFIGEGEPKYGLGIRPLADQVGDPVDDHAGFSAAGSGENKDAPSGGVDGLFLGFVQFHNFRSRTSSSAMSPQQAFLAHWRGMTLSSSGGRVE